MPCSHEIIIHNVKSQDVVCYPILIIEGCVKNDPERLCASATICINFLQFKTISQQFKGLVELQVGQNTIRLTYCCCEQTITVFYVPRQSILSVLPLYIICQGHDGRFQAPYMQNGATIACKKITLCAKLLQSVIAEKLHEAGYGRKTFNLEDCIIFRSKLGCAEARGMTQETLWRSLGREIIACLPHATTKFLGFVACTRYCGHKYREGFTHDDIVSITQAHVALGGGGLALFGTACLYTWPDELHQIVDKFEDCSLVDKSKFMDDSCYKGTFGGCFSTTLGSVLHELCHTFDLGHTDKGVMGTGFDDMCKIFLGGKSGALWRDSCVALLAYHKWMNNGPSEVANIKFDPVLGVVRSTKGLRVIEMRREEDQMVLNSWIFTGRVLKYSFQIPDEPVRVTDNAKLLVVEDNCGNILKQVLSKSEQ